MGAFMCSIPASARGVIVYGIGDALKKIHELPDSLTNDEGNHFNLGVHYQSFSLFWCPVWNYGEYKYALVDDKEEKYIDITTEEAKEIAKEYKFDIPDQPSLPLGTQLGLKPVILLLIVLGIYGQFSGKKKKKEEEETASAASEASTAPGTPEAPAAPKTPDAPKE